MAKLFGTNGIRGVFGKDLTLELALKVSYALGVYYNDGKVIVGYDGRNSNTILSRIVRAGINSIGLDTVDAGLIPTPCLQYATKSLNYKGGVMITASHNPPEYNGIKVMESDGIELSRDNELRIEDIYFNKNFRYSTKIGKDEQIEVTRNYIDGIKSMVDIEKIKKRNFKVVLDLGNGAQAVTAPQLLRELGCKVIMINENIDGSFPGRGSEPTLDNLQQLSESVRKEEADIGVAYDGDGDRSIFCDEYGNITAGDRSGAILLEHVISKYKGTIVTPINSSVIIDIIAEKYGCKVIKTKVGSVEVSRKMAESNAIAGLEENGGFMYGKHIAVRDGAMSTALMLEAILEERYSQLINRLPKYYSYKTKFPCSKEKASKIINSLIEEGERVDTLDGVKIWIDDDSWIMVRLSGTEPIIRLYAEAKDKLKLEKIINEYKGKISRLLG
ncbi:MAG: phosphoglucosamine mutase [Candidatus Nitrosocaldaceae archaeon]